LPLVAFAALSLPLAEVACAVALLRADSARWGAMVALGLLSSFTGAVAVNMMRGRHPNCHCFGQLHSSPAGWTTLSRNVGFAAVAAFVLWDGRTSAATGHVTSRAIEHVGQTGTMESSIAFLWFVVVGQGILGIYLVYHLLRQNGRLLERVDVLEAR